MGIYLTALNDGKILVNDNTNLVLVNNSDSTSKQLLPFSTPPKETSEETSGGE